MGRIKPRSATQEFTTFIRPGGQSFIERMSLHQVQSEESDDSEEDENANEVEMIPTQHRVQFTTSAKTPLTTTGETTSTHSSTAARPSETLFPAQPFPGVVVCNSLGLAFTMAVLGVEPEFSTGSQLRRQPATRNNVKSFRHKIVDAPYIQVFAFMRPGLPYINLTR